MEPPETEPQPRENFTPTPGMIAEARGDLRVMACARAAYEAYATQVRRERGWEPPPWQTLLERPAEIRTWIAATLAVTGAIKSSTMATFESGSGLMRYRTTAKLKRPEL